MSNNERPSFPALPPIEIPWTADHATKEAAELRPAWLKIPSSGDAVYGGTPTEHNMHLIARAAFLQRLCDSERAKTLFRMWTFAMGFYPLVLQLNAAIRSFDELQSQQARASVIAAAQKDKRLAQNILRKRMWECDTAPVLVSVWQYTDKELHVPTLWLAKDVLTMWGNSIWSAGNMTAEVQYFFLEEERPPAPSMEHFRDLPGESFAERLERYKEESARFVAEMEAEFKAQHPRGTKGSDPENVKRYVDWFYRHMVEGEPIRHIAAFDADGRQLENHRELSTGTVHRGIKAAQAWLHLAD